MTADSTICLDSLSDLLYERIEDILDYFDLDYHSYSKRYAVKCPIHNGSKRSLSIYHDKDYITWSCFTQHCEEGYTKSVFGLLSALLEAKHNKPFNTKEVIDWASRFVGGDKTSINPDELEISNYNKLVRNFNSVEFDQPLEIPVQQVIESLKLAPEYYINRGFSKDILTKYCVGLCDNQEREMYNRIVFPIFSDEFQNVIGCIGRSIFDKCLICEEYHNPDHPCTACAKWRVNKVFPAEQHFYNWWSAKKYIRESGKAIILEGQGDVLRLEQCNIRNSIGMLGTGLTEARKILLERSGATDLYICGDNDKAGERMNQIIINELGHMYNIKVISTKGNDFGDTPDDEVLNLFHEYDIPIIKETN